MTKKKANNVILMDLNDQSALLMIRKIVRDTSKVIITNHAQTRMNERDISAKQIFDCLNKGTVSESPHKQPNGDWKLTLSARSSGSLINVAIALTNDGRGNLAIVVTTF
jgi:hypothetical protein